MMKQWSKALVFILAMAILLAACGADPQTDSPTDPAQTPDAAPTGAPGAVQPNGEPERPTSDRPVSSKDTLIIAHEPVSYTNLLRRAGADLVGFGDLQTVKGCA